MCVLQCRNIFPVAANEFLEHDLASWHLKEPRGTGFPKFDAFKAAHVEPLQSSFRVPLQRETHIGENLPQLDLPGRLLVNYRRKIRKVSFAERRDCPHTRKDRLSWKHRDLAQWDCAGRLIRRRTGNVSVGLGSWLQNLQLIGEEVVICR